MYDHISIKSNGINEILYEVYSIFEENYLIPLMHFGFEYYRKSSERDRRRLSQVELTRFALQGLDTESHDLEPKRINLKCEQ